MNHPCRTEVALLHRVENPESRAPRSLAAQTISPADLRGYLALRRDWKRDRPEDLLCPNPQDHRGFLLTFDDGFRSVLTQALPIMEETGVHGVVLLTTGFVDGTRRPYESLLWSLMRESRRWIEIDGRERILNGPDDRDRLYEELRLPLKPRSFAARRRAMEDLATLNRLKLPQAEAGDYLSWEEVRMLDRHPLITVGAHTRSHPQLNALGTFAAAREILGGKREIERQLNHPIEWFAYPYGAHGRRARALVRWSGFRGAFATSSGVSSDRFAIPRVDPRTLPA